MVSWRHLFQFRVLLWSRQWLQLYSEKTRRQHCWVHHPTWSLQLWTPLLSLGTVRKLDAGDFDNSPLSDRPDYEPSDEDQEMTIVEERPGTTVGNEGASPADTETGSKDMGCNPRNLVDTQDPILPSTSNQLLGPTGPNTGALASAVEIWALTSPALALTMAQIQEAAATGDDNGDTDEEKIWLDAYKGVMQGLHVASQTLLDGYQ